MYPNFEAERARKGLTLEKLVTELESRGMHRNINTISAKLAGKRPITLEEGAVLKDCVSSDIPLDELFKWVD